MDFAGPFKRTKLGNPYFLVIQDDFSRFLRIIPSKECNAKVVLGALENLTQEEGIPREILTDNGTPFCNSLIENWTRMNNVRHLKSPPGHQSSNGMAERAVRTIKYHLRTMPLIPMEEGIRKIQFMYNRTAHPATGFDPFMVARGRISVVPSTLPILNSSIQKYVGWSKILRRSQSFKNKNNERKKKGNDGEQEFKSGDAVFVWEKEKKNWRVGKVDGTDGERILIVDGKRISKDWVQRRTEV
jgi:hypothetical protein